MKVIHLTDIHLTQNREQKIFDVDPYENFDFVCEEICRIKNITEIELIVISGDITHNGDVDAYRYFLKKMEALMTPYIAILGNHDLKSNFNIAVKEEKTHSLSIPANIKINPGILFPSILLLKARFLALYPKIIWQN